MEDLKKSIKKVKTKWFVVIREQSLLQSTTAFATISALGLMQKLDILLISTEQTAV